MPITLIDKISAGSVAGGDIATGAIDSTGGTLAVICLSDYAPSGASAVIDSDSNSYGLSGSQTGVVAGRSSLYYVASPVVGAGHTFSTNMGGTFYSSLYGLAFSGVKAALPHDQSSGALTAGATTLQPGSVTPTEDNELVITCVTFDAAGTISIDSGFTLLAGQVNYSAGAHFGIACAYKVQTTAGAENPTWTLTASAAMQTRIATFKAAATGARVPYQPQYAIAPIMAQ